MTEYPQVRLAEGTLFRPQPGPYRGQQQRFKVLGLDLGQSGDHAAGVVLERTWYPVDFVGPNDPRVRCTNIRRWPLGTDYTVVCRQALEANPDVLAVEFNGVGRPFVDMLRVEALRLGSRCRIRPILTAASHARQKFVNEERGGFTVVPKIDLVSAIECMRQDRSLVLPDAPEVRLLLGEMADFRMRVTRAAHLQFGAERAGSHDDLVMAMALACWTVRYVAARQPALYC